MERKIENKKIELYETQEEVITRIKFLRNNGYEETDMYVLANGEEKIDKLRGVTENLGLDKHTNESEGLWDKFKSYLQGEDTYDEAFSLMGVSEFDTEFYLRELNMGKILLYIDRVFEDGYK